MPKTLKDYIRHNEDCRSLYCVCGFKMTHEGDRSPFGNHDWQPAACTCGLDALLQSSEGPQETNDHGAALLPADPSAAVKAEPLPNESIDGVDYRIEVTNGVAFMEPGHDQIVQSTTLAGFILYFSERSVYRVPAPQIGSGTQSLSEASGCYAQERERTNTHAQPMAEGRETPDLQRGER
jgi:hypothetical protein